MNQHSQGKTALLQPGKKALKMKEHESKNKNLAVKFTCMDGKSAVFGGIKFVDCRLYLQDNKDVKTQRMLI